jgi:TolB protein
MGQFVENTNITEGLRFAQRELQNGRSGSPHVIILLTDGVHNVGPGPISVADDIRGESSARTVIIGVAVGSVDLGEIIAIAGGEHNVIHVPDFDGLRQILSILHDYSCAVATEGTTDAFSAALVFPTAVPQQAAPQAQPTQVAAAPAATQVPAAQAQPTVPPPPTATPVPTQVALAPLPAALADTQIAFSSNRDGDTEIFLMEADGQNQHQMTSNNFTDDKPDISPDGRQIAWESNANGTFDIWVMNIDGTDAHPITDNNSQDWGPAWSPDGSQIAFHSVRGDESGIWIMDADGGNPRQLTVTANGADRSAAWSPDGSQIVYYSDRTEGRELYIVDVATGDEIRLTENEVYDGEPDWFGDELVFASTRSSENTRSDICFMSIDGSNSRCLTAITGTDDDPSWSPDGDFIVFESGQSGNFDIWIMRPDGSELRQITSDGARDWSADWGVKP